MAKANHYTRSMTPITRHIRTRYHLRSKGFGRVTYDPSIGPTHPTPKCHLSSPKNHVLAGVQSFVSYLLIFPVYINTSSHNRVVSSSITLNPPLTHSSTRRFPSARQLPSARLLQSSTLIMPHTASSSKHATKLHRSKKDVVFGSVEVIPDFPSSKSGRGKPSSSARISGSKLKRSPTPVLTSLADLANAHRSQLSGVWNEKNLPNFEADKRSIAATRQEMDPFDF